MRKSIMSCDTCSVEARHPYDGWFALQTTDLKDAGWLHIGGPSGEFCSRECVLAAVDGLLDRAVEKREQRKREREVEDAA